MAEELETSSGSPPLKQRGDRDEKGRFTKNNPHRWQPGQSGNTAGRRDALTDALRRRLNDQHDQERTKREAIVDALIEEACAGSVRAAALIIERLEGKLPSTVDLNITRSEYEQYDKKIRELQEVAYARGTPISRAKAVFLIGQTDPRIKTVIQDDGDE